MATNFKNLETLKVEEEDCFVTVTIDRPAVLNALNKGVINELTAVTTAISQMPKIRGFFIQSSGEKAFVAGADIQEMSELTSKEALEFSRKGQKLTQIIEELPCISIAVVQGFALGGGCELALACDCIVASEKALFGQPEVDLGLVAGFGGTQRLTRRVGLGLALDILCCGKKLTGHEAYSSGLASRVTPPENLADEIAKIKKALRKASPLAVRETKKLTRQSLEMSLPAGLNAEAQTFANLFENEEARQGMKGFLTKEKPNFSI